MHAHAARAAAAATGAGGGYGWATLALPGGLTGICLAILIAGILGPLIVALLPPRAILAPRPMRAAYRHHRKTTGYGRRAIPAWMQRAVRYAGRNRCCACHSRDRIQIDHIRPYSRGGLAWIWNLALLCATCNIIKSDYDRTRSGLVYHPFRGRRSALRAAVILGAERTQRLSPLYWLRVSIALIAG